MGPARAIRFANLLACAAVVLALGALGGCAAPPAGGAVASPAHAAVAPRPAWWNDVGDPALTHLIDDALRSDRCLRARAQALDAARQRARQWPQRLRQWVAAALGARTLPPDVDATGLALARQRKAVTIAHAYVRLQHLRQLVAMRAQLRTTIAAEARIAGWRFDAGRVSGVDVGLAASLQQLNAAALDAARTELAAARAALARRSGWSQAQLDAVAGSDAAWPMLAQRAERAPLSREARAARARTVLRAAAARAAALVEVERGAMRTVDDARLAYGVGSGDFAALYVAETAALQAREARLAAQAAGAQAAIRMWGDAARSGLQDRCLRAVAGAARAGDGCHDD